MKTNNTNIQFTFTDDDWDIWKHVYYTDIANPPTMEEMKEIYPDIYEMCVDTYKDCTCINDPTVTIEDVIYESMLEHYKEMLLVSMRTTGFSFAFFPAQNQISHILKEYEMQNKKQTKQEYLKEKYIEYRNYLNRKLYGEDAILLCNDCNLKNINETFDIENPELYQQLCKIYFVAFFCKYYSEYSNNALHGDSKNVLDEFKVYLNVDESQNDYIVTDLPSMFSEWLKEDKPKFDLATLANKNYIMDAMEDLGITQDHEYRGGSRSKSILLGFVEACKEKGVLPDIANKDICENIAKHIKMDYQALLKASDKSKKMLLKTKKYISNNEN